MDSDISDPLLQEEPYIVSIIPADEAASSQPLWTSAETQHAQHAGLDLEDDWGLLPPGEKSANLVGPHPTRLDHPKCNPNCDTDCLCHILSHGPGSLITDDTTDDIIHSVDVDDIYQVLGKDILKSSLLDDIGLYLECDDDTLYDVSPEPGAGGFSLPKLPKGSPVKYRVTFLLPKREEKQIFLCDRCAKTVRRENLLKDHFAKEHGVLGLFPCSQCAYVGNFYRHWQKHFVRQHLRPKIQGEGAEDGTKSSVPGSRESLKPHNCIARSVKRQLNFPTEKLASSGRSLEVSTKTDTVHRTDSSESVELELANSNTQSPPHIQVTQPTSSEAPTSTSSVSPSSTTVQDQEIHSLQKMPVIPTIFVELIKVSEPTETKSSPPVLILPEDNSSRRTLQTILEASGVDAEQLTTKPSLNNNSTPCRADKRKCQSKTASPTPKAAKFRCEECSKTFKQRRCLVSHLNEHNSILNHQCFQCQKRFASSEKLRLHLKTHSDEKLECQICQKTFKRRSALTEHVKTVHGPKNHKCLTCGKAYAFERDLKAHQKSHSAEFKCSWPECEACFRDSYNLKVHMQKHTGQTSKTCLYCSYTCIQKTAMDNHMKKHANIAQRQKT